MTFTRNIMTDVIPMRDTPRVNINALFAAIPPPEPLEPLPLTVSQTPIHDLMLERSETNWGEHPEYTPEYRKLRWPGAVRSEPLAETEIQYLPVEISPRARELIINGYYPRPPWMNNIRYEQSKKREGRWSFSDTRMKIRSDLRTCMSENIPFKTKTYEYKPSDQWIYVHGVRALKYDIRTGYIVSFTYSGVYNKRTTLLFRIFGIDIKLVSRKLIMDYRPTRRPRTARHIESQIRGTTQIDLNRIYDHSEFPHFNERGIMLINHRLDQESRRRFVQPGQQS